MKFFKANKVKWDTKRVFLKKGTCSRAFFYLLNREFGHVMDNEEQAADPLAGGILQQGYQCGLLWGVVLALGAESYRRSKNLDHAIGLTIRATQHVMASFVGRAKSPDCSDITETEWSSRWSLFKFFIKGKMFKCFGLADKWAPDAFEAAKQALSLDQSGLPKHSLSCASEVVKRMGASEEEMAIVAGFAGGIGLSGNGCGALAAAIWLHSLERVRKGDFKYSLSDPPTEKILTVFLDEIQGSMECREITDRDFKTIDEHTAFVKSGGCKDLIIRLAEAGADLRAGDQSQ